MSLSNTLGGSYNILNLFTIGFILESFLLQIIVGLSMVSPPPRTTTTTTLGGANIRNIVLEAASAELATTTTTTTGSSSISSSSSCSLDLNGIVWMEHINLIVESRPIAERFYMDFLGFSKDKSKSFHVNLGQQQLHLAETGDPSQRLTGSIGLVVPTLSTVRQRAEEALDWFRGTAFSILVDDEDCITLRDPFGGLLHLYGVDDDRKKSATPSSAQKMTENHAPGGIYGATRMAIRCQPGIRFGELTCRPGTAGRIGRFYREVLRCDTYEIKNEDEEGRMTVVVSVGPGVHLIFHENDGLTDDDVTAMEGVHICVYVHDFEGLYDRLDERRLIWTNPRFVYLDRCDTWEEARASRTLRFKDIIDVDTGEKLFELEHEVRPLRHGQYMKVPYYVPK